MLHKFQRLLFVPLLVILFCCNEKKEVIKYSKNSSQPAPILPANTKAYHLTDQWKKYWYDGKAELTTYLLKQSRYGEIHEGTITNIFVTEDFSKLKQVKPDNPSEEGSDKISVLKLNQAVKFVTGIYPYSLMLSCFSPVDIYNYPHPIKVTATAQEWCGHSFFQLNNRNNRMLIEQRSYFETEGDQEISLEPVMLEDECWNIIRIDPEKLPTGKQMMLPGALYLRLSHKAISPVSVQLSLVSNDSNYVYTAAFQSLDRKLNIIFDKKFPYQVFGWNDRFPGTDGKLLATTATLHKTMRISYWTKHNNIDTVLRKQLGLPASTQ